MIFWDVTPCAVIYRCQRNMLAKKFSFYPEDGNSRFLLNTGTYLPNYAVLQIRRQLS
jgi:hypothetical protein